MLQPEQKGTITRKFFQSGNIKLSYLDFGGDSQGVLLLLHGHMNKARTFSNSQIGA
ncbi:hypothetical protein [Brevibacillus sp. HB1.3]|uniref:hypothetical protein n=1 Tax=Brevibacillus sp. HB1.3 TaxID=2738842 RepID=UPI003530302C